jgi:hypothetical protein
VSAGAPEIDFSENEFLYAVLGVLSARLELHARLGAAASGPVVDGPHPEDAVLHAILGAIHLSDRFAALATSWAATEATVTSGERPTETAERPVAGMLR